MKCIVTGGAGFIGSNLCDRLISEGNEVICLDNLYTGDIKNIEHLINSDKFKFINHDVSIPYDDDGVDVIFNFACPASPPHYQKDPVYTTRTSVMGMMNMLELAKKNDCIILQASTSEVYGDALETPQTEKYFGNVNPIGIRSCYDEGKRCAESLCMDYHRMYGVKIKIIRIFNTYGPRMRPDDGRVVSNFIVQTLKGEHMTVYGDGNQTRSFQYIDDLIDAVMKFIRTGDDITGPINIGNPHEITINQLLDIIIEKSGSSSGVIHLDFPSDDPHRRCPDISNTKKVIDWKPVVDIDEGISKTMEYFKKVIN